jgi:hypothetical protein
MMFWPDQRSVIPITFRAHATAVRKNPQPCAEWPLTAAFASPAISVSAGTPSGRTSVMTPLSVVPDAVRRAEAVPQPVRDLIQPPWQSPRRGCEHF